MADSTQYSIRLFLPIPLISSKSYVYSGWFFLRWCATPLPTCPHTSVSMHLNFSPRMASKAISSLEQVIHPLICNLGPKMPTVSFSCIPSCNACLNGPFPLSTRPSALSVVFFDYFQIATKRKEKNSTLLE